MKDLDSLRRSLSHALDLERQHVSAWFDPVADKKLVEAVQKIHSVPAALPDASTIEDAVNEFRRNGKSSNLMGMIYVCYGAATEYDEGDCLLSFATPRKKLFEYAEAGNAGRQLRCFEGLLAAYWMFDLYGASESSLAGWKALRAWLSRRRTEIEGLRTSKPQWFGLLGQHSNLLSDTPCDRYGSLLLKGDGSMLQTAIAGLQIPDDSWVKEEAVISQLKAGVNLNDDQFRKVLPSLLSIPMGQAGIRLSERVAVKCIAMLVSRYAACRERPEQMALRDAAVNVIGNPWLNRTAWDAFVLTDNGRPDSDAREMVNGWLKRRLITDFFELLTEDDIGDTRRLNYWLRFEPHIEDMWFALGSKARSRRTEAFLDFKTRAKGRLLNLEQTTADNNAFIMRMGGYMATEFGVIGNAFYITSWSGVPADVLKILTTGQRYIAISRLRDGVDAQGHRHRDSPVALKSWEQKFDEFLCPMIGHTPETRPAFVPDLETLLDKFSVQAQDFRLRGGALWILADDSNQHFNREVKAMGFEYRRPKGWWKE